MKAKSLMILGTSLMGLAACTSGDINLSPSTNISNSNNTTNNGGGTSANAACASYQNTGGQTIQGKFNSTTNNCEYSSAFADNVNPIKTDLFIPALENDGAHVFAGSLFIGEAHDSDADLTAAGIAEGGDGPTLTIEAGATLAFTNSSKFSTPSSLSSIRHSTSFRMIVIGMREDRRNRSSSVILNFLGSGLLSSIFTSPSASCFTIGALSPPLWIAAIECAICSSVTLFLKSPPVSVNSACRALPSVKSIDSHSQIRSINFL